MKKNRKKSTTTALIYTGVVDHVRARFAYILQTSLARDPMVRTQHMGTAVNGDVVRFSIHKQGAKGRAEGRIVEVLKRGRQEIVGTLQSTHEPSYVRPDHKKMHYPLHLRPSPELQAHHGEKVCVSIEEWPSRRQPHMVGTVKRFLGQPGGNEAEMYSVLNEFSIPTDFPEEVLKEARAWQKTSSFSADTMRGREDFSRVLTFTIDPEDAKDFDDALSLQALGDGRWQVGIHIADVSHYVPVGSALDREALKRGNTTYLVGKAFPMLPDPLSNDLCSLRPMENRLVFSAVFVIDEEGHVLQERYGKGMIYSRRRFTYEEAQTIIDTPPGRLTKEDKSYYEPLTCLNQLAKKMARRRFAQGAINFRSRERLFSLDEEGMPLSIVDRVPLDTHKLVEEYMLLANRKVAEYVYKLVIKDKPTKPPFIYRTHDAPDMEKLQTLFLYAQKIGHRIKLVPNEVSNSLNQLMQSILDTKEENILTLLALRSMAKAKYQAEEAAHFGLSFKHYTHFTSPIRRYSDIMTHRLLFICLQHEPYPVDATSWAQHCLQVSATERRSVEAERAFAKYKQVQFMVQYLGQTFTGVVSGLTAWGIYVEIIQTKCEGMIRLSNLGDYYTYDAEQLQLVGRQTGDVINLGDELVVQVTAACPENKTIDLLRVPTTKKKKAPAHALPS